MRIIKLVGVLFRIGLLSPIALIRLVAAIYKYGINLMALLSFSARTYGDNIALADEKEMLSFHELLAQSERLSAVLKERYQLASGKKVGLLCKNHASMIKTIFAVSSSGADLYLLNPEMSDSQLNQILERQNFDLLIYDEDRDTLIGNSPYANAAILSCHDSLPAVSNFLHATMNENLKQRRASSGKLVLLTGGTTGNAKEAGHKPSLFNYLDPFSAFLTRLKILYYQTAYIATPIYHGYGIAVFLLFCAVGKKVVVRLKFDAEEACKLIREHQVEVVTVVPLMLHKMLNTKPDDLKSLKCIASGGAELSPKLVEKTSSELGEVLYNLYGTSEGGLNIIATPQDLAYSPRTIGRKIKGVRLKVLDGRKKEVAVGQIGHFCVRNSWSIRSRATTWIETGDMGYRDENGYYFLCGRVDSMIVSAGENVYPHEVEQVLLTHHQVEDAAVIGVPDELFGQRLKAFVVLTPQANTTKEGLIDWLRPRLARYQMPKEVCFVEHLPYTPLGKLDRKQLQRRVIV